MPCTDRLLLFLIQTAFPLQETLFPGVLRRLCLLFQHRPKIQYRPYRSRRRLQQQRCLLLDPLQGRKIHRHPSPQNGQVDLIPCRLTLPKGRGMIDGHRPDLPVYLHQPHPAADHPRQQNRRHRARAPLFPGDSPPFPFPFGQEAPSPQSRAPRRYSPRMGATRRAVYFASSRVLPLVPNSKRRESGVIQRL